MSHAFIDYPGYGRCSVVTGSVYNSLDKEILSRLKFMIRYDFFIEMNLDSDRYNLVLKDNPGQSFNTSNEKLSELLERTATRVVHPDDYNRFKDFFDLNTMKERVSCATSSISTIIRERNSRDSWDNVIITLIPQSNPQSDECVVLAFFYVESEKIAPEVSKKERDGLTGLLKKSSFKLAAQDYLKENAESSCIIYMDIEHFRFFNKWYSRWQGDLLLKNVGMFLLEMDRKFNSISGYDNGDDFFILCKSDDSTLEYLVQGLNKIVSSVKGVEGFRMCYGGYKLQNSECDILDVLDSAQSASSVDKTVSAGKIRWFSESIIHEAEEELKTVPEVERALEENEFTFYLQPKCSIKSNRIIGAEALVRWIHKTRGVISPAEFIPPLERSGNITKLDSFLWECVCKKIREWKDKGITPVPISVNVSRIDIFNLDVPKIFNELVKKYEIDPKLIEIEITESAFVDDIKLIRAVIQTLRLNGFTILIDDFGSGYSSLNMLKDVQADVIKMDMKFFDLDQNNFEKGLNIIQSVVDMSHSIGLPVIAEGVETQGQIDLLGKLGLNYVQGYFYYKPLPIEIYEKLISEADKFSYSGLQLERAD